MVYVEIECSHINQNVKGVGNLLVKNKQIYESRGSERE